MQKIKVVLNYQGTRDLTELKIFSRGLNRQVIKWLNSGDPELVKEIKSQENMKPFTISHLSKDKKFYSFIITLLNKNLEKVITQGMEKSESEDIDLNYEKFELLGYEKVLSTTSEDLKKLSEDHSLSSEFEIEFISETCFSQKNSEGKRINTVYSEPDITKIFDSILAKWNLFMEDNISKDFFAEIIPNCLEIVKSSVNSNNIVLGYDNKNKMGIEGFRGVVKFKFLTKNLEKRRFIALLASYSEWCGVGKKTAFGMGQTKVRFL